MTRWPTGLANQEGAGEWALAAGANLRGTWQWPKLQRSQVPILLFYLAPVLAYGRDQSKDAKEAGVDGVLPLDLPPEEDLSSVVLQSRPQQLVSLPPTNSGRREMLAGASSGCVLRLSLASPESSQLAGRCRRSGQPDSLFQYGASVRWIWDQYA